MAVTFVGDDGAFGANFEFDVSATLPLTEGDVLFVFLVGSVADTPNTPAGWTLLSMSPVDAEAFTFFTAMWGYYHVVTAGDSGVYDFTNADPESLGWSANFVEYSGVDTASIVQAVSKNSNGNATPTLTLSSLTVTRTGSRVLMATANQIVTAPTIETFTQRTDGPMFVFDRAANPGATGDVVVVSANEVGTGWDLGFLIVVNPPLDAGARFDCAAIDSQIN